jgi:hypothetical protein
VKVRKVLSKLIAVGLYLNPIKYKFSIKKVKYLGFIFTISKGISYNPKKL